MKKEISFIVAMIVLGAAAGLLITVIIGSIAVPALPSYILTPEEKADYEIIKSSLAWIDKINLETIILPVTIFITIVISLFFLVILNPNLLKLKSKSKLQDIKIGKVLLVLLSLGILTFLSMEVINRTGIKTVSIFGFGNADFDKFAFIIFLALGGLLWLTVGEMGWGGDFTSWKFGTKENKGKPVLSFILGGIFGVLTYTITILADFSFYNYFKLVSEVWGKSVELSNDKLIMLGKGLILFFSISSAISAGLITALAPVYSINTKGRIKRLAFPVILFLIVLAIFFPIYKNAEAKYDLAKKNLSEAAGIPEKASVIKTMILLKPEKNKNEFIIHEFPLQVNALGFTTSSTIEVSYSNLEKVKNYIKSHKEGSFFQFSAEDALSKGYFILWDLKEGLNWQSKIQNSILHRMIMVNHLQYLPVTSENLELLKGYTDEKKWYVGGKAGLLIAKGFIHFGMIEEAKKWIEKARQKGVTSSEIEKVIIPSEPVLLKGKVYGSIKINGNVPKETKIAIFANRAGMKISDTTSAISLADVRQLSKDGRFSFENIGQGEYFLAIMTDKEVIPYNTPPKKIKITKSPGVITFGGKVSEVNAGNIEITVSK